LTIINSFKNCSLTDTTIDTLNIQGFDIKRLLKIKIFCPVIPDLACRVCCTTRRRSFRRSLRL